MPRPVLGISCFVEPVSRGRWVDQPTVLLAHNYVRHVEAAGGIAVLLPPRGDGDEAMVASVLSRIDGLVLTGGVDVAASRYGAEPHPTAQPPRPDRDSWELSLAAASAAANIPVLGICRGMQVMAVAAGGTLEQHVPDRVGHDEHLPHPGQFASHPVRSVAGTRIGAILGVGVLDVPTHHHQAVATHPGYQASAWHADETLEAMEDPTASFRLAVQWHPEAGADPRLFSALVEVARRGSRASQPGAVGGSD